MNLSMSGGGNYVDRHTVEAKHLILFFSCVQLLECISTLNIPGVGKNLPGTAL